MCAAACGAALETTACRLCDGVPGAGGAPRAPVESPCAEPPFCCGRAEGAPPGPDGDDVQSSGLRPRRARGLAVTGHLPPCARRPEGRGPPGNPQGVVPRRRPDTRVGGLPGWVLAPCLRTEGAPEFLWPEPAESVGGRPPERPSGPEMAAVRAGRSGAWAHFHRRRGVNRAALASPGLWGRRAELRFRTSE
jgi:hypothetical protein